jgi:hypothetical protein
MDGWSAPSCYAISGIKVQAGTEMDGVLLVNFRCIRIKERACMNDAILLMHDVFRYSCYSLNYSEQLPPSLHTARPKQYTPHRDLLSCATAPLPTYLAVP